jgi:DNA polymerase-3 subunit epsilon
VVGVSDLLAAQRFAVVDTETSGLEPRRHRLLQVGVVVIDGTGTVHDRWSALVKPASRWRYRVGPTQIHGITRAAVRQGEPLRAVLQRLQASLDGAHFVGHNASFDVAFLTRAAERDGITLSFGTPVCTLALSRQLDPDRQLRHRLSDVCDRYGVALVKPHDALADADATAAVLPHLLRAHGITHADQLSPTS